MSTQTHSPDALRLTEEQKTHYWENGFVIVPSVIDDAQIDRLKKASHEVVHNGPPEGMEKWVVRDIRVVNGEYAPEDPESGVWKLMFADRMHETFGAFGQTESVLDIIEDLIGPDIALRTTMIVYKPPGIESIHHYHQDGHYMAQRPFDGIMGVWIPLDPVHEANGTMSVIPGSHKLGLLPHEIPEDDAVNLGVLEAKGDYNPDDEITLEMNPGDGLFFHPILLHRTGANSTQGHRRVATLHVASGKCKIIEEFKAECNFQMRNTRLVRGRNYEES